MKRLLGLLAGILMVASTAAGSVTLSFNSNITTGFCWYGEVIAGDSVALDSEYGQYVSDPVPEGTCGGGGTTYFKVNALHQGRSVLAFVYERSWEPEDDYGYYLAEVDAENNVTVTELPENCRVSGVVASVDVENRTAMLEDGTVLGFEEESELPKAAQGIKAFLREDGTAVLWQDFPAARMSDTQLLGGTLVAVSYSDSGDMLGNTYRVSLKHDEDGVFTLCIEQSEAHNLPIEVSRYRADEAVLERIAQIVRENGMEAWENRQDKLYVCDASQPYLTLYLEKPNGKTDTIGIDGYIMFTSSESKAYKKVINLLYESSSEENLIEEYTREKEQ